MLENILKPAKKLATILAAATALSGCYMSASMPAVVPVRTTRTQPQVVYQQENVAYHPGRVEVVHELTPVGVQVYHMTAPTRCLGFATSAAASQRNGQARRENRQEHPADTVYDCRRGW